jgi:hypothetical protein
LKIILFWTNFFFILFLSKKIIGNYSEDNEFIIKNLLFFFCAIIFTGAMLHFLKLRYLKLSIPLIWIITILLVYL